MGRYVIPYHRMPLADSASLLCYSMVIGLIALVAVLVVYVPAPAACWTLTIG